MFGDGPKLLQATISPSQAPSDMEIEFSSIIYFSKCFMFLSAIFCRLRGKGMKRVLSLIIIGLLCTPMFSIFVPHVNGQETVVFQDDFESYAVSTFPYSSGWEIVWNGAGNQYQVITDSYYASPTRSLQLRGSYGWSVVVKKDFSSNSSLIGYEARLMAPPGGGGGIAFCNIPIETWGRYYAYVGFSGDGFIWACSHGNEGYQQLQPYTSYTWYKIRVLIDRSARIYDVWIDDVLKGHSIPIADDPWEILSLQFQVGWIDNNGYFDDVKVFSVESSNELFSLLWTKDTSQSVCSVVAGDINNDGKNEVVYSDWSGMVYAVDSFGNNLWSYPTGWYGKIKIGDLEGDGRKEVVVASANHNIYCLDGVTGNLLWSYATVEFAGHGDLVLADVNGDGKLEIVTGEWDSNVYSSSPSNIYVVDANGNLVWEYTLPEDAIPTASDVDNDGRAEVVAYYGRPQLTSTGYLYMFTPIGQVKWSISISGCAWIIPIFADIDGDGTKEIVMCRNSDNAILVFRSSDGYLLRTITNNFGWLWNVVDLNLDGQFEFLTSSGVTLSVLDSNGSMIWQSSLNGNVYALMSADLNGDSLKEVVVGSTESLSVLSSQGSVIWSTTMQDNIDNIELADVDGDSVVDIIAGTSNPWSETAPEIVSAYKNMRAGWGFLTASPYSRKVVPSGGTSYTISLNSLNLSAVLSFSVSITGINGYFVPQIIGGPNGSSTSSLFISTFTSTACGVHIIVITATPNSDDPTLTPISTQVTLEVMGGIVIAVMDACSDNKPIIGAKVVIGALSGVTGASGILTFPSLGTGYYDVTISAKGYSGDVFTNKECPRVYTNQYLEVGKTFNGYLFPLRYTLTINVHDQYGNPVDGASGDIYDSNGHIYGAFATPPWGYLTMQNLEAATGLTMIVQKYGYETKTLMFDITSDVTLNIVLNDLGVATTRLSVHVEHAATGIAISGATVQVAGQTGTTDRIGNAYFSALQFKEYIVTVSKVGYATAYARITISRTSPTPTIKVNLTPEVFGIFVHVQDSLSAPISGATVTIPNIPGKFTDTGGDAVFTGISSGTYTITASKAGCISSSTVASLVSSNVWVTITLQSAALPDFSVEVDKSYQKIRAGESALYKITLTSINGFNQRVDLSISTFPRPTHIFSPSSSIQLSPGGTAEVALTIITQPSDAGEHQYVIECSYLGSPRSIVHSSTVTLAVSDFEYNIKISRSQSNGEYYLFDSATFNIYITDVNLNDIDPYYYAAYFDGKICTDEIEHYGTGWYKYTTKEFNSADIGSRSFAFVCRTPSGSSFVASDTIEVRLHKETLKLVFSEDEQYFPVDGLFYDDQNVSNNKANYQIGTKPSSGVKAYSKVSTHDDDPDIGSDEYIVQYWIYYAYNDYKILNIVPNEHEHDFESITLWISKPTFDVPARITKMILSQHMWVNKYYRDQFPPSDELLIAVEKGGHGMMLLKELGSFYAFFELPWESQLNPAGIFQGTFNLISSPIYPLVPAYDATKGNLVEGFGDPSTLRHGFNYDYIFPAIFTFKDVAKTLQILGYLNPVTLPFIVESYCFYLVFCTDFVSSDVLKSNDPFSITVYCVDVNHMPPAWFDKLSFYIVAPWKRPEFLKPTLQEQKIGFVEPYPLLKGALKESMNFMLSGFMGKGEELEWLSKIARIENIWIDPVNVTVVDSNGWTMTSTNENMTNEIPGGSIYVMNEYFGILFILNATDNYSIMLSSDTGGEYSIELSMIYANSSVSFKANEVPMEPGSVHTYSLDWDALAKGELGTTLLVDQFGSGDYQTLHVGTELTIEQFSNLIGLSNLPPKTILAVTEPKIITENAIFVTPTAQFILSPISERHYQQGDGFLTSATSTDIAGTFYRIFNTLYDSGWLNYTEPFCLYGLDEGTYTIQYYSIDKLGNNETINSIIVTLQEAPLPTTYSLTITTAVGGTTDPAPGTYTYTANETVQITAIPNIGYLLDHWELNGVNVGSANPYTISMNANHTLRAVFLPIPPPLSASVSPLSASILVGQSVTFTSAVSGGYMPYSYQWYLNGNPISSATSNAWTFTPVTSGIYYVHLKVTDAEGNTVQSETARITVATVPVGGYSIPIRGQATAKPVTLYLALTAILSIVFVTIKRKTTKKTKQQ